ncbi:hypothetical protein CJJ09_003845 [Candidozyma auris]|nr:hypothetical protein CJJ09_003845 [[Candida] auris]
MVPQQFYPVYYAPYPEAGQSSQGGGVSAQQQQNTQGSRPRGTHSKSASQSEESENLGSPYSHKYPTVVFQSSPLQYPHTSGQRVGHCSLSCRSSNNSSSSSSNSSNSSINNNNNISSSSLTTSPALLLRQLAPGGPRPLMPSQFLIPPPVGTVFPWGQAQAPVPERKTSR